MLRFEARGLRANSALPSSLRLLLFFLPFTWDRHRRVRATTALPVASSLYTCSSMTNCIARVIVLGKSLNFVILPDPNLNPAFN
jgi:hypothetical protein